MKAGIRSHQLILPSVVCSTHVSRRIAQEVGGVTFAHQHGCAIIGVDVAGIDNFFIDLASHPNVASVLVVALGCETIQGNELAEKIVTRNPATKYLVIQESAGVDDAVSKGVVAANSLASRFPEPRHAEDPIVVGISSQGNAGELVAFLQAEGLHTVESSEGFSALMSAKVHLIVSFTDSMQPPTGFPLIPVINIASDSELHLAFSQEFDLSHDASHQEIAAKISTVARGEQTKSEANSSGEIVAPRLVRSV
ncbi:unannotated protein [freshwater metagenome]|uniref:Unannotated protein n=1 Tax=freshwater metagenome TaxID=449393 RepID=A0A6J6PQ19_9ZZZZ|nr:UxaA family hydrolase [Actinomycetota bacterium]MSV64407.1 hypothetical protein [Actinomycetota bacterium]MSW26285.1 hypothetical protein [Actinomycetota bacterium]MSW34602.1 hypothetical protein [Actinomycetota bacterium]MSX31628.1 hypothetical protein [Actinomycetota bacterium]